MASIPPEKWIFARRYQRILESKECLADLHGRGNCGGKIVRAHVIPRSQLRHVADGGQVHAVPTRFSTIMQMHHSAFEARDIGIGEFSVLNCFCMRHDKTIFAPLEDRPLVFSPEQLALLHYRAMAAEACQRRGQEDAAAAAGRMYKSDDPRRERHFLAFQIGSLAAETAEDVLKRIEGILETARYQDVCSLVVCFDAEPALLSVGAFRPLYDMGGRKLQDFETDGAYLAIHMLIAGSKPALVFTWLRGQKPAERFVRTFVVQPRENLTTVAIQLAFEHAERTCMKREWWLKLNNGMRQSLLKRVQNANSLSYQRPRKYLAFEGAIDDWKFSSLDLVE